MQFNRPVRETLVEIISEYRRFLPVTLYEGDEYTVPDGDLEGTLFDTVAAQDDRIVLTSAEGTYAIAIDEAPVPASALAAVARLLVRKEWDEVGKALLDPRCDRDLCAIDANRVTRIVNERYLWLDANRACERQVFECLLALGGPHCADDLLDDGCGDLFLGDEPDNLPTVFTGNGNADQFTADEISWVAERSSISLTLRESASGREARFVVLPDTLHGIQNHPDAPKAQGLSGAFHLENALWRSLSEVIAHDRQEETLRQAGQPAPGHLYVLAIRDILRSRAADHTSHDFERSSYEYQADIPHITAWWGGPLAVQEVYIHQNQDSIGIYGSLCGLTHDRQYYGDEAGVPWDRLFSEVYSQLQGEDDPDWEEWLDANTTRLLSEAIKDILPGRIPSLLALEDGADAPFLLPQPFCKRARLLGVSVREDGTLEFGVDIDGGLFTYTPDDLDTHELLGMYLTLHDLPETDPKEPNEFYD